MAELARDRFPRRARRGSGGRRPGTSSRRATHSRHLETGSTIVLGVVAGALLAVAPLLAFGLLGIVVAILVATNAATRLAIVVFGALLVLQSSDGLSGPKVGYLALYCVAVSVTLINLDRLPERLEREVRPLMLTAPALLGCVVLSLIVGRQGGTLVSDWARDSVAYIFLAFVPFLAVDAASRVSQRTITRLFVAAGLASAVSLALTWIERRGFADLPLDKLFFPSIGLTTALFIYALARAQIGTRHTVRWTLLAGLVLTLMLVTGTRTNLLFLLAPILIALLAGQGIRSIVRLSAVIAGLVVLAVLLGFIAGRATGANGNIIGSRLASVGSAQSGSVAGQSLRMRVEQTQLAWRTFESRPLTGVGLGHRFVYEDPFGYVGESFYLDTPAIFPAKLGLIGALVMALLVGAYWRVCRSLRLVADRVTSSSLIVFLAIWILALPLGLPIEEKGFSLGLVFLIALALASVRPEGAVQPQWSPARSHPSSGAPAPAGRVSTRRSPLGDRAT